MLWISGNEPEGIFVCARSQASNQSQKSALQKQSNSTGEHAADAAVKRICGMLWISWDRTEGNFVFARSQASNRSQSAPQKQSNSTGEHAADAAVKRICG